MAYNAYMLTLFGAQTDSDSRIPSGACALPARDRNGFGFSAGIVLHDAPYQYGQSYVRGVSPQE